MALSFFIIGPKDAGVVLGAGDKMLAIVADIAREDLIVMSLKKSYVFAGFSVPKPSYSVETCA